jgi:hypothetical protein
MIKNVLNSHCVYNQMFCFLRAVMLIFIKHKFYNACKTVGEGEVSVCLESTVRNANNQRN